MGSDKNKEKLEKLIDEGRAGGESAKPEDFLKTLRKLDPEDQVEIAEKLVAEGSGRKSLIGSLYQAEDIELPALMVLGRHLASEDLADKGTLETMEKWSALCEEEGKCDLPELFTLPDNVQSAVIVHLGRWLRSDLLAALLDMAPDKSKSKQIKKALHQARSAGAALDESAGAVFAAPDDERTFEKKDEAYVTPPDSTGATFFYFYRTVFGKDNLFVVLMTDVQGVLRFENFLVPEQKFRRILESTKQNPHAILVKIDPAYARYMVKKAETEGERRGHEQSSDFLSSRRILGIVDQEEVPHPVWQKFSEDELKNETGLVSRSAELLDHRVFEGWSFLPEDEGKILLEIQNINQSPLDLTDAQKEERKQDVFEQEASWKLSFEGRNFWRERMLLCAYILGELGEPEKAHMAAAAAIALEDSEKTVPPFFTELLRQNLEAELSEEGPTPTDIGRGGIVKA